MNIKKDKILHLAAGFIIALLLTWISPLAALLVVVLVGIMKELFDYYFNGTVDKWDFVATVIGGLPVIILGVIFNV